MGGREMADIDFLPKWYRLRRRHQKQMQRQWIALGLIFLIMITWNSFAARSISMASAELSLGETQRTRAEHMSHEYDRLRNRLTSLQKKLDISSLLDVRLDVAATISRLTHLIPDGAVVEKLQLKAKKISDPKVGGGAIPGKTPEQESRSIPLFLDGDEVHFQLNLCVEIANTEAIASFLTDLEQSPYFKQVHLHYLRSKASSVDTQKPEFKADDKKRSQGKSDIPDVSQFEIQCYVVHAGY
jgi:Tfp pilus assembly protein PilN